MLGHQSGVVRVAVLDRNNNAYQLIDSLNDSQTDGNATVNVAFQAQRVNGSQIDTLNELNQFDVVFIGAYHTHDDLYAVAPALRQWVEAGGGLVASAPIVEMAGQTYGTPLHDIDAIVPVDTTPYDNATFPGVNLEVTDPSHPVTLGVNNFYVDGIEAATADTGATTLATYNGDAAVVLGTPGAGRSVFLAPFYVNSSWELAAPDADRLVEQAVAWAAGDSADQYQFQAIAGDTLAVSTFTPGDTGGEPGNNLDLAIALRAPDGSLVPSGDYTESSPDGRNVTLAYTAAVSGTYTVVLTAQTGAGAYQLRIDNDHGSGIDPTPVPQFEVTAHTPAADARLPEFPATYRVRLSDQVLLTSVDAGDLSVNGIPADSVAVLDGNTLEFTISSADQGEALYDVAIASDTLTSVSGLSAVAYSASFRTDYTAPTVTASSVEQYAVVAAAPQTTLSFALSEVLQGGNLGVDDVELVDHRGGVYAVTAVAYDSLAGTVTVGAGNLPEGDYTVTLKSRDGGFEDVAGNDLDGEGDVLPSGDNNAGGDYVFHFTVDAETQALTVPMAAIRPDGALVYGSTHSGIFHAEADEDDYTLDIEAGQVLTVVLSGGDTLLGLVTLLGDDGSGVEGSVHEMYRRAGHLHSCLLYTSPSPRD